MENDPRAGFPVARGRVCDPRIKSEDAPTFLRAFASPLESIFLYAGSAGRMPSADSSLGMGWIEWICLVRWTVASPPGKSHRM